MEKNKEYYYEINKFNNELPYNSIIVGIEDFNAHVHSEIEMLYVIDGYVNITVNSKNYKMNNGDFIFINSKEIHHYNTINEKNIVLVIKISTDIEKKLWKDLDLNLIRFICNSLELRDSKRNKAVLAIREEFINIAMEMCIQKRCYEMSIYTRILRIITLAIQEFENYIISKEEQSPTNEKMERIETIFKYIDEYYFEPINIGSVSEVLHLNSYYLSHFFTDNVGMSFNKYLAKIRIEKAKKMLQYSEKSITEIALDTGFVNVKAFNRNFKSIEGISPKEFKDSNNLTKDSNLVNAMKTNTEYNNIVKPGNTKKYSTVDGQSILNILSSKLTTRTILEYEQRGKVANSINVNIDSETNEFNHYWKKLICAGRAAEGLREDWRNQLRQVQSELQFQYIRFHGVLNDDMMIYHEVNGRPIYSWQYFDMLFDFLKEVKLKPIIELGLMPGALGSGNEDVFWWKGNITPPKSYEKWNDFIRALVVHVIDRYGIDEVTTWYFEVWNEPNTEGFWTGTIEEYFKLYKNTVNTIKNIDSNLKVGGPSTTDLTYYDIPWFEEFVDFCKYEELPIDFVTLHPYPNIGCKDEDNNHITKYMDSTGTQKLLRFIREKVDALISGNTEILLTEWNSSFSCRDYVHDTAFKAPFIIKNILESVNLVDALGYWVFSDVFEEDYIDNRMFHGGFGLINLQGLKKPAYHAYWFLSKLGTEKLDSGDNYFITKKSNSIQILMWNYCHYNKEFANGNRSDLLENHRYGVFDESGDESFSINIENLNGNYKVFEYCFDRETGSVFDAWVNMGSPENINNEEKQILDNKSKIDGKFYVLENVKSFSKVLNIRSHGVYLIELIKIN